ncbi:MULTISPECIES: hypothetical protein [unclassified Streptomyces]|uniref:hypothetical protein n=1 Tax=unclassified Streptomyces TaxID=2593676 RepID=UPI00386DBA5C|nr:hypothetical protein OG569_26720 [Streptomyces sp. NBC_00827]
MEDWIEESGFEVNPAVVKEFCTSTFDEAMEAISAARTLGLGVQFRNYWERVGDSTSSFTEGFQIILYEDMPLRVDDEGETGGGDEAGPAGN